MLGERLIIVSDAHLGATPPSVEEALLAFLADLPTLGDSLLVSGDLFNFWFAYRHALPRRAFRVAAALQTLGQRVPVAIVGGNHDRWGSEFWATDCGFRYGRSQLRFQVGRRPALALHGDGLADASRRSRLLHRLVGSPLTTALYRLVPPDLGIPLVERIAPHLGALAADTPRHRWSAERQRVWAEATLRADPSIDLLIMGHTHRPAAVEVAPGRHYLNPGAWFDGLRYAVATETDVEVRNYRG